MCQFLNADEKHFDDEKALLLLASHPKNYRNIVQTLLIGRESITLDQALVVLRENNKLIVRFKGEEKNSGGEDLYEEISNRGRTKDNDYQGRGMSHGRNI